MSTMENLPIQEPTNRFIEIAKRIGHSLARPHLLSPVSDYPKHPRESRIDLWGTDSEGNYHDPELRLE